MIMKSNILYSEKAQAALELAVFGSLILVAFSMLIMYGQRLDLQQHVKMEAFRKAAQQAYDKNGSVSYTLKKDTRFFNMFGGFGQGQAAAQSSTASVMWQKGMTGDQGNDKQESYAFYVINDQNIGDADKGLERYPKDVIDYTGADKTAWVPVSVWSEEQERSEEFISNIINEQDPSTGVKSTKYSELKDNIRTVLKTRVDTAKDEDVWDKEAPLPEYKYGGTTYSYDGQNYTVTQPGDVEQGVYYNPDTNRMEYSQDRWNRTVRRERSWQTGNE